jgi:hypothetical protein
MRTSAKPVTSPAASPVTAMLTTVVTSRFCGLSPNNPAMTSWLR